MTTNVFLFVYMVLAGGGNLYWRYDWQNLGEFYNDAGCHVAAQNLGISKERYRCISRKDGEIK